jgi:hypothetical protein
MGKYLFDQYTFLHFSVGVIMYFIGFNLIYTIIIHTIFEFIENTETGVNFINKYMTWFWPGGKDKPDLIINSMGDTVGVVAGWLTAKYLDDIGKANMWV